MCEVDLGEQGGHWQVLGVLEKGGEQVKEGREEAGVLEG